MQIKVLLVSVITLSALAYSPKAADPEASKVAKSVVDQYISAYDKHDPKAVAALFVPDGVFLPANGSPVVQGRDEIEHSWADLFKNVGGQETITIKDAIPAGKDAVVAVTEFKIVGDGANANKVISGRAAITLTKTPEGWRYVSIAPQIAPPPPAGPTGSR